MQPAQSHGVQSQLLCLYTQLGLSIGLSLNRSASLSYHNRYFTKHSHSVCRTQRSCRSDTRTVYQSLSLQRARLFGLSLSHPASQSVISLSYHSKSDAQIHSACSCRSVAIRLTLTLFVALPLSLSLSVSPQHTLSQLQQV